LRWGQSAFANFAVVPPDTGICHQVNLEFLADVVSVGKDGVAYPDTLVGTDSHTTMINGLGVLGWGVGGIEAEAAMLGQPMMMLVPRVIGVKVHGSLRLGVTATDLVLMVTELLRARGVVNAFVEFYGSGLTRLGCADRATLANMAPEYGATMGFFPVDAETLAYLRLTGRSAEQVALVEAYCKEQGLFRTDATVDPIFSDTLDLDLDTVVPAIAGPKRPQDRVALSQAKRTIERALVEMVAERERAHVGAGAVTPLGGRVDVELDTGPSSSTVHLGHGAVVIAAITSCTNTSNPSVMLAAGLLAKAAVERGLATKSWVKTSLAPGSQVVTSYLARAALTPYLEALGFHLVGYGCTTCIGNSGPLPAPIAAAVKQGDLVVASVLSGNRNFEGRVNAQVRMNFLASPPLVVAYALAGRATIDFESEPLGHDRNGTPVFLADVWPTPAAVSAAMAGALTSAEFAETYRDVFAGSAEWRALDVPRGESFAWDARSTYIRRPPFFDHLAAIPTPPRPIAGARVLLRLGDSITTDHISPAGSIATDSPAGRYLAALGVAPNDFNSYGSRRGNHEVMVRGTFANLRLRNLLVPEREGGYAVHLPSGEIGSVYDVAMRYAQDDTPLIVLAGAEYGTGSSRDWAAKGTALLGVRAVIAKSFERIHRANLVGMGVLPLQFEAGADAATLGLSGRELYEVVDLAANLEPRQRLRLRVQGEDGASREIGVVARIDTEREVAYYAHGGILAYVLRELATRTKQAPRGKARGGRHHGPA